MSVICSLELYVASLGGFYGKYIILNVFTRIHVG